METFRALWSSADQNGQITTQLAVLPLSNLVENQVVIRVLYSSLNYKDALSSAGHRGITRDFPHIPGIDAAGIIHEDPSHTFEKGAEVLVTGFDMGMQAHGGLAEFVSVPAAWVIPKPEGLSLKQAMQFGTAGLTAAMAVMALQQNDIVPESGEVLVSGASGGVGMISILILKALGYQVVALSGKPQLTASLLSIGVTRVIERDVFLAEKPRGLYPMQFAGAIDTLGGDVLVKLLKSMHLDGTVAACGMAASVEIPMQIYPFILRGARLIGIYSADASRAKKMAAWQFLASLSLPDMPSITQEISLAEAPQYLDAMLQQQSFGRYLVVL